MILKVFCIYLFFSVFLIIYKSSAIITRSKEKYIKAILILIIFISTYIFGYIMELRSVSYDEIDFWNKFQYIVIPFLAPLWFSIALIYAKNKYYNNILIYVIPIATLIIRLTNDYHHLYYAGMQMRKIDGGFILVLKYGYWYYLQIIYNFILIYFTQKVYISEYIKIDKKGSDKIKYTVIISVSSALFLLLNLNKYLLNDYDIMAFILPIITFFVLKLIVSSDFLEVKTLVKEHVFDKNNEAMILLKSSTNYIIAYNEEAEKFFGSAGIEICEKNLDDLLKNNTELFKEINSTLPNIFKCEFKEGLKYFSVETSDVSVSRVFGLKLKTIKDVTDKFLQHENLKVKATVDDLSGLLNRRTFFDLSKEYIDSLNNSLSKFSVLMMDIDYFKIINDTYGHMAGDYTIQKIGEALNSTFRKSDIIGRLGGEEFAVLVKESDICQCYEKAEIFRKKIENLEINYDYVDFKVTISIGVVSSVGEAQSISVLLSKADKALYISKKSGRNMTTIYE